jgi:AAA15 family ATPase/GTPase
MVHTLRIKHFKSIRNLDINARRINVFIGEPNSGKSNIIEALSLLSPGVVQQVISHEIVRYKSISDLFFDFNVNTPIEVFTNDGSYWIRYAVNNMGVPENQFDFDLRLPTSLPPNSSQVTKLDHQGKFSPLPQIQNSPFKYYQYKRPDKFILGYLTHLAPPFGENLPSLLLSNEDLRTWVSEFFESKDFNLTLKPAENDVSISKLVNKSIYSYPYFAISETLQRVVFYILAIKSNKNSILLFDEPESNTFPFYTKFLAESIALDQNNQYFLTTHNPYLLLSLLEKSPKEDINVFVTKMTRNFDTKTHLLSEKQLGEVLDLNSDVFFNLDRILD